MVQLLRPDEMIEAAGWREADGRSQTTISTYNDNSDSTFGYASSTTNYLRMGFPVPTKTPVKGNITVYLMLSQFLDGQSVIVKTLQGTTKIDSRIIYLTNPWGPWETQSFSVSISDYSDLRVYLESATTDVACADVWVEVPDGITNGLEMGCSF